MKKAEYIEKYGEGAWRKKLEGTKRWKKENKKYYAEKLKDYYRNKSGRASHITQKYRQSDKVRGFDVYNNINAKWIVDNIFNSSCIYCGDSEWTHLGVDRIDNSKPHTPDNCVCACFICNVDRSDNYSVEEFKKYRQLHPRILKDQKSWEIVEQNGNKVLKKRANI